MDDTKLVVIKSCGSRLEAELVKGALEAAGIAVMTQADTVGRMREHIAWSGTGFQVVVRQEDAGAARDVLSAASEEASNEADVDSRPSWRRLT